CLYLKINNVSKTFHNEKDQALTVFQDIDLDINEGEFVSLLGPSGCGKSTLLSIIAGLAQPSSGSIFLENAEVKGPGPDKSMVFQEAALFPWLTVSENIRFPLRKSLNKKDQQIVAAANLQMVHFSNFAIHNLNDLSAASNLRVSLPGPLPMVAKSL